MRDARTEYHDFTDCLLRKAEVDQDLVLTIQMSQRSVRVRQEHDRLVNISKPTTQWWPLAAISPKWQVVEFGVSARNYFAAKIKALTERMRQRAAAEAARRERQIAKANSARAERQRQAEIEKKERQAARRRELAKRTPEEKAQAKHARGNARAERERLKAEREDRATAAHEAYVAKRAAHLTTEELLGTGDGWTRHYIKTLMKPDWVEEFTTGYSSSRKDVTRFLYHRDTVAKALPTLTMKLAARAQTAAA